MNEHTKCRETFVKGGFVSVFADTTDEYCLFRFSAFFHDSWPCWLEADSMNVNIKVKQMMLYLQVIQFTKSSNSILVQQHKEGGKRRQKDHNAET